MESIRKEKLCIQNLNAVRLVSVKSCLARPLPPWMSVMEAPSHDASLGISDVLGVRAAQ